jgi:hypothetical protein
LCLDGIRCLDRERSAQATASARESHAGCGRIDAENARRVGRGEIVDVDELHDGPLAGASESSASDSGCRSRDASIRASSRA